MDSQSDQAFQEYINLCTTQSGYLQFQLSNNSILEWFGRTIRGKQKICNFFRYDLCQQYEHRFYNHRVCEEFESRPSHFETKEITSETTPGSSNSMINEKFQYSTPIVYNVKLPELPPLQQGRNFIMESDSEDDDLKDLGLEKISDNTPPPSPYSNFEYNNEPEIKKFKHSNEISLDEHETNLSTLPNNEIQYTQTCTNEDSSSFNPNKKLFSELKYIETIGILRMINRTKHRGVHQYSFSSEVPTQADLEPQLSNNSYWDRETKIRISYRIRLSDNHIQFALIIYEHLVKNPSLRRNLLSEFKDTAGTADTQTPKNSYKDLDLKRKTPLKHLR